LDVLSTEGFCHDHDLGIIMIRFLVMALGGSVPMINKRFEV
jgi:hypothetical protein